MQAEENVFTFSGEQSFDGTVDELQLDTDYISNAWRDYCDGDLHVGVAWHIAYALNTSFQFPYVQLCVHFARFTALYFFVVRIASATVNNLNKTKNKLKRYNLVLNNE